MNLKMYKDKQSLTYLPISLASHDEVANGSGFRFGEWVRSHVRLVALVSGSPLSTPIETPVPIGVHPDATPTPSRSRLPPEPVIGMTVLIARKYKGKVAWFTFITFRSPLTRRGWPRAWWKRCTWRRCSRKPRGWRRTRWAWRSRLPDSPILGHGFHRRSRSRAFWNCPGICDGLPQEKEAFPQKTIQCCTELSCPRIPESSMWHTRRSCWFCDSCPNRIRNECCTDLNELEMLSC